MLQSIITNLPYFLLLLLGFGFIIFVHELGHFLVAKAVGIKCTQFAVGMGPAIVAWRKGLGYRLGSTEPAYEKALAEGADVKSMGETEYRLCWLPIGGYVKMLGQEDMDATAGSKAAADPRSYTAKPIWARMCVISAGVVMNIIFGLVFFAIAFSLGVKFNAPVVGPVAPGSKAATTYAQGHEDDPAYQGLRAGDTILTLDGQPIADLQELRINVALSEPGHPMTLVVDRDGQPLTYVIEPEAIPGYMQGLLTIGFDTPITLELTANLPPDRLPTALVEAGVRGGMRVTAVDGKPVAHYGQFREALLAARGREVPVTFRDEAGNAVQVALAANPQPQINLNGDRMTPHVLGLESAVHIESVIGGSAAEAAGIQPGDILARLGRYDLPSVEQVLATVADAGSSPLELAVIREGRRVDLPAVAPRRKKLGIAFGLTAPAVIRDVLADSPAAALRLPPGTQIVSVDGQPVDSLNDLQRYVALKAQTAEGDLQVTLVTRLPLPGDPTETATITVPADAAATLADAWRMPLPSDVFELQFVTLKAANPIEAIGLGIEKTNQTMMQVYVTIARLFQGSVGVEHLQGPVGIVHTGTRVARQGGTYLLFFLGLISINLAVINFLPIPIVDGGHMVFLAIEKIKGSPVSDRVQTVALYAGLALILSIFAITFYHDVARIFFGAA